MVLKMYVCLYAVDTYVCSLALQKYGMSQESDSRKLQSNINRTSRKKASQQTTYAHTHIETDTTPKFYL